MSLNFTNAPGSCIVQSYDQTSCVMRTLCRTCDNPSTGVTTSLNILDSLACASGFVDVGCDGVAFCAPAHHPSSISCPTLRTSAAFDRHCSGVYELCLPPHCPTASCFLTAEATDCAGERLEFAPFLSNVSDCASGYIDYSCSTGSLSCPSVLELQLRTSRKLAAAAKAAAAPPPLPQQQQQVPDPALISIPAGINLRYTRRYQPGFAQDCSPAVAAYNSIILASGANVTGAASCSVGYHIMRVYTNVTSVASAQLLTQLFVRSWPIFVTAAKIPRCYVLNATWIAFDNTNVDLSCSKTAPAICCNISPPPVGTPLQPALPPFPTAPTYPPAPPSVPPPSAPSSPPAPKSAPSPKPAPKSPAPAPRPHPSPLPSPSPRPSPLPRPSPRPPPPPSVLYPPPVPPAPPAQAVSVNLVIRYLPGYTPTATNCQLAQRPFEKVVASSGVAYTPPVLCFVEAQDIRLVVITNSSTDAQDFADVMAQVWPFYVQQAQLQPCQISAARLISIPLGIVNLDLSCPKFPSLCCTTPRPSPPQPRPPTPSPPSVRPPPSPSLVPTYPMIPPYPPPPSPSPRPTSPRPSPPLRSPPLPSPSPPRVAPKPLPVTRPPSPTPPPPPPPPVRPPPPSPAGGLDSPRNITVLAPATLNGSVVTVQYVQQHLCKWLVKGFNFSIAANFNLTNGIDYVQTVPCQVSATSNNRGIYYKVGWLMTGAAANDLLRYLKDGNGKTFPLFTLTTATQCRSSIRLEAPGNPKLVEQTALTSFSLSGANYYSTCMQYL